MTSRPLNKDPTTKKLQSFITRTFDRQICDSAVVSKQSRNKTPIAKTPQMTLSSSRQEVANTKTPIRKSTKTLKKGPTTTLEKRNKSSLRNGYTSSKTNQSTIVL